MWIDEMMQYEEKTVIHDLNRMLPDESYMCHRVYYQVLIHKILIDMNLIQFYEILQVHSKVLFLYISLQIQLEILLVHVIQF